MKSNEEYLNRYHQNKKILEEKDELWRLKLTEEEFISEIANIRRYGEEARKGNYLNEYHIQRNEEASVGVLLMNLMTKEESIEQMNRLAKQAGIQFAKEAPEIQKRVKLITTPLQFTDVVNIYRWLWRKQITLGMIPSDVLEEFMKTEQYRKFVREKADRKS